MGLDDDSLVVLDAINYSKAVNCDLAGLYCTSGTRARTRQVKIAFPGKR